MIIINEEPKIKHEVPENIKEEIENYGYALPDDSVEIGTDNTAILHFMNVDDHIDGNGLSILWLIEGEGAFFIDGEEYLLKKGDAIVFDDNIEHGFSADVICSAINFTVNNVELNEESVRGIVANYNTENQNINFPQYTDTKNKSKKIKV